MEWIKRNEEYIGDIACDDSLSDTAYVEVLEDLADRAQAAIDAKQTELENHDDESDDDDSDEDVDSPEEEGDAS